MAVAKVLPLLAMASLLGGCSRTGLDLEISDSYTEPDGAVIDGDDTGLFVGQWICTDTETTNAAAFSMYHTTDLLTFSENGNGSLTMVGVTVSGPGASPDAGACATFTFYVWGPTATASSGPPCSLGSGNTATNVSGSFVVSGDTATFNMVHYDAIAPSGSVTITISGTCTRYVPDAGSD